MTELLQGGLGLGQPSGAQNNGFPRAEMVFGSRLRTLAYAASRSLDVGPTRLSQASFDALAFFGSTSAFMPVIRMAVNPNSVKFSQPKRWTKKDTREGSTFFHFTNSRGQNNDILTMTFTGSTGNIDLRGSLGNPNLSATAIRSLDERIDAFKKAENSNRRLGEDTGALYKFLVWHNLYKMTREPMLLADGTQNVFSIIYRSALFPVEVTFRGFFSTVLEFEEVGDQPNSRQYTFAFTVQNTTPDLDDILQTIMTKLSTPVGVPTFDAPADGAQLLNVAAQRLAAGASQPTEGLLVPPGGAL